ncbi:MAG TPA: porin family protein [Sunxiuqinia sp.]|nr:porin family protein [Sunxiuqinia sp.]
MKNWYLFFLTAFLPLVSFGQGEYYSNDSLTSVGINLIDGGDVANAKFCRVKDGDSIFTFTPYEVDEYGFNKGPVYIAKDIQVAGSRKRVFLERLYQGETTLYYYQSENLKTFFVEKDSTLFTEVPKQNKDGLSYSEKLLTLTNDCPNVSEACKLVRYSKNSLSKLIARYNKCELKPFPHFKYGLLVGYEFTKLVPVPDNKSINYFDYDFDGGYTLGIFIDNPILVSNFSFHAEMTFSQHGFSYHYQHDNSDMDLVANIASFKIPLLIRYTAPTNKIRPFVNIGGITTINTKNKCLLYESTIDEHTIEINDTKSVSLIHKVQAGYAAGGGIEYKLDIRHSITFEIRYHHQYGFQDSKSLQMSGINLITGISF